MIRKTQFKRTPFKPAKGKVWKRLQPISKMKHRREARFWPKEVTEAIIERSGGRCESLIWDKCESISESFSYLYRCSNKAIDKHHKLPKSRGGKSTLENALHLCRECHRLCKDEPLKAKALGILL